MSNTTSATVRAVIDRENARPGVPPGLGPRTPKGRKRASLNALRHGRSGQAVVSPQDDLADGPWRLNRARVSENNLLTLGFDEQSGTTNEPTSPYSATEDGFVFANAVRRSAQAGNRTSRAF